MRIIVIPNIVGNVIPWESLHYKFTHQKLLIQTFNRIKSKSPAMGVNLLISTYRTQWRLQQNKCFQIQNFQPQHQSRHEAADLITAKKNLRLSKQLDAMNIEKIYLSFTLSKPWISRKFMSALLYQGFNTVPKISTRMSRQLPRSLH